MSLGRSPVSPDPYLSAASWALPGKLAFPQREPAVLVPGQALAKPEAAVGSADTPRASGWFIGHRSAQAGGV